ncbi:FAD-binding protein [Blastopirellula sp. JC732]|uniref:FAD-binding protein n=1 Tax=Blastopirellula sediminis TaxID=2894196 RepID=A0A9X1MRK4_9BACT|nr:D-arabinono-1,4-lactone oxidase [Blastopirellula sediminis]MCC9605528.1 FAD-binding protein [Blastopirellula sediminis]MCC9631172.1 FAD-binding protein [Blastopirellula sediminis]
MPEIVNFGGNVRFVPAEYVEPADEQELLAVLARHASSKIRVVGSRHSWSDVVVTAGCLINMNRFRSIEIREIDGQTYVTAGAGCQVKQLLAELNRQGLTLPSVGLISEQTISGATATGTHGSGKHSLSHYLSAVRVACFAGEDGAATIVDIEEGDELRAARCSLGCLGVVVAVTLPCVPQYRVAEKATPCETLEETLALEERSPLQQFFFFPHSWKFFAQERAKVDEPKSRSEPIYRIYWFLGIDIGLHLLVKLSAAWLRSRAMVRFLFRHLIPMCLFPKWRVVGRSDQMLIMEHELFRHLELEAFVPDRNLAGALELVRIIVGQASGALEEVPQEWSERFAEAGLTEKFASLKGVFMHHYPICIRKVLQDDTLISMASGDDAAWYAISFITYVRPRDAFFQMATFLAESLALFYEGRIHWGKWFPLEAKQVERMYPHAERFLEITRRFDPHGVFRNDFVEKVLPRRDP